MGPKRGTFLAKPIRWLLSPLFFAAIPISLPCLNMEPMLLLLGQDQNITSAAMVYITYSIPDLLAQVLLHPLKIFLRTQGITKPITLSAVCTMLLRLPINYFLVVCLNMVMKGVALASAWNTINLNLKFASISCPIKYVSETLGWEK